MEARGTGKTSLHGWRRKTLDLEEKIELPKGKDRIKCDPISEYRSFRKFRVLLGGKNVPTRVRLRTRRLKMAGNVFVKNQRLSPLDTLDTFMVALFFFFFFILLYGAVAKIIRQRILQVKRLQFETESGRLSGEVYSVN